MTEFAIFERRYADAFPFGDWLDLMAGRMLQLFYRAWAESQPAALADRPGMTASPNIQGAVRRDRGGAGGGVVF
ncbi:MAG: type VI secretion system baseplate subunit TssG [Caenibius sp.]